VITESEAPPGDPPVQVPPCTVHLVFGPPGTGKTRYLTQRVKQVVAQHGPESLVVASFSVTSAREIASRGLGLPDKAVGTLHSLAYRAIGHEFNVALDPKTLADWNAIAGHHWRITPDNRRAIAAAAAERSGPAGSGGDELLAELDRARATYLDPADYPPELAEFARAWSKWKTNAEAIDFSDMIEMALEQARDGQPAPGNPLVLVVDEGQDMTRLEVDLALAWGRHAKSLVIALDDDQAIMEWRGGDPAQLLGLHNDPAFEVDVHVLDQSWRIPTSVHAVAERWVKQLSVRQPKVYRPRTTDRHGNELAEPPVGAAFRVVERLDSPELVQRIEQELDGGRTVMVIASCTYMLQPLVDNLREAGVPYHNPYRPAEGRWNPFGGNGTGTSTAERVFRFLVMHEDLDGTPHGRLWTGDDVRAWLPLLDVKKSGLRRGVKTHAETFPGGELAEEDVAALFASNEAFERAAEADIEWFAECVLSSKELATAYPLQVARKRGPIALADQPGVIIGTIHSVKGGASDVVYVSPDISAAGAAQLQTVNGRDQTIRQFYVAMTRSYEELRVLAPHSKLFISRSDLIPASLEVTA
jgi:DNA helicase II / ATP-dependent DNA helicase PcrA